MSTLSPAPSGDSNYSFVLYNSTTTTGLTLSYEKELLKLLPDASVVARGNSQGDYQDSLLIDLNGDKSQEATRLAGILGLKVNFLPSVETKPDQGNFLIILGKDKASVSP